MRGLGDKGLGGVCESELATSYRRLRPVWDQSNLELASTLFVFVSYARNRSLDRDLFCEVSSARLLSAIHIPRNSLLQRTEMSISWGQSRIQRHTMSLIPNICISYFIKMFPDFFSDHLTLPPPMFRALFNEWGVWYCIWFLYLIKRQKSEGMNRI